MPLDVDVQTDVYSFPFLIYYLAIPEYWKGLIWGGVQSPVARVDGGSEESGNRVRGEW